jgi:ABC-type transport system involved in cytochrome bd biosynthesis fused ATPase/permease subunit
MNNDNKKILTAIAASYNEDIPKLETRYELIKSPLGHSIVWVLLSVFVMWDSTDFAFVNKVIITVMALALAFANFMAIRLMKRWTKERTDQLLHYRQQVLDWRDTL